MPSKSRQALWCAVVIAACGRPPPEYTGSGGGGGGGFLPRGSDAGTTATDAGSPVDAGAEPDAGSPEADGGAGKVDAGVTSTSCVADEGGTLATGPIRLSEVAFGASGTIEVLAAGDAPVNLVPYTLAVGAGTGPAFATGEIVPGGRELMRNVALADASGEFALERSGVVVAYLCWGTPAVTELAGLAVTAGAWFSPGVCPALPGDGQTLHNAGLGVFAADWVPGAPSLQACVPPPL